MISNNDVKISLKLKKPNDSKHNSSNQTRSPEKPSSSSSSSSLSIGTKNAFFIEGGGTRGVYAIGILKYLFENNPYFNLRDVDIFGGTSVGSFLAAALSLGYQKQDMIEICKIINIADLIDSKYRFMTTAYRFISQGHLYDDTARQEIVKKILDYKIDTIKTHLGIDSVQFRGTDLTFGHLKILISSHPTIYKHLLINAVDISRSDQIFMTSLDDKYTDIKLFDAILASSSIPFVFKPVTLYFYPELNKYGYDLIVDAASTVNCLVDGAVSTGNPLDFFLLNDDNPVFSNYELWLLKFTSEPKYVKIDGISSLLKQTIEYSISGKNDIKMDLIQEHYHINIINLHSHAGTLDIYTVDQVISIIDDIYNKCVTGKLYFNN